MVDGRIKRRINRETKKIKTTETPRNILQTFSDHLLLEIFIRLSDCGTAIRCSAVCKSWSSLICSPEFIRSFRHRPRLESGPPRPYTHLLSYVRTSRRFHQLSSVIPPKPLPGKRLPRTRLKFLPRPRSGVQILATSGDLLLASRNRREYLVCNPLTGQSVELPQAPKNKATNFGLFCESSSCDQRLGCNCNIRFRVVLIKVRHDFLLRVEIFCSETWQWTKSKFEGYNVVASDGGMHWLMGRRIFAFDHFSHLARYIKLPAGFVTGFNELFGTVQGRLRLSQLTAYKKDCRSLKVWELNYSSGEDGSMPPSTPWWVLVHQTKINTSDSARLRLVAFHPDDGDVIFVWRVGSGCGDDGKYSDRDDSDDCVCDEFYEICEYNIAKGKLETNGQLPGPYISEPLRKSLLNVFTLSHPTWPTLIPRLPHV